MVLPIGTEVKIVDTGKLYTTYADWFKENEIPYDYAVRYCYCGDKPKTNLKYKIVGVGKHIADNSRIIYAIQECGEFVFDKVYLIGCKGVEPINTMTSKEVYEKYGVIVID